MAKNISNKSSKAASSRKAKLESSIKVTKLAGTKLGAPAPGGGWRLALNHNETLVR
jgi:hypothetical protein